MKESLYLPSWGTTWRVIGALIVLESLSLATYANPALSATFAAVLAVVFVALCIRDIRFGLYIALAELMIGSKGYLFFITLGSFKLSLRLILFVLLFVVWMIKEFSFQMCAERLRSDRLFQIFHVFMLFIVLGVAAGLLAGYPPSRVFFDMNGYLYFGLFYIFFDVYTKPNFIKNVLEILFGAVLWMSIKTMGVLYIFSHSKFFEPVITYVYKWIRDTGVGEITFAGGGFWRIFFQSQIFELVAIFMGLAFLSLLVGEQGRITSLLTSKRSRFIFSTIILSVTAVLISFSRSFWLGALTGYVLFGVYLLFARFTIKKTIAALLIACVTGMIGIGLIFGVANFPIPEPTGGFGADLLKDRLISLSGAAVSSRWNLLPPLMKTISAHPFVGSGFGTTVTYQSEDPRVKTEDNPDGWYTTDTFEWGYLDTITEIGSIGLGVYLLFIILIAREGWKALVSPDIGRKTVAAGFLIGLAVVSATHGFSPYLNHPLGIGYLLITIFIFKSLNHEQADMDRTITVGV